MDEMTLLLALQFTSVVSVHHIALQNGDFW